jgi:hypothetical protein
MSDEELLELVGRCTFRSTKPDGRYRDAPHAYIVRSTNADTEALFVAMKEKIAGDGYAGRYGGFAYRYYHLGGYKYWAFRLILNREKLP